MANTYLTIDMITAEAVRLFKNSNLFIMNMDTQYDGQFAVDGAKIGDTLRIRLPSDFIVTDGPAMQLQGNTQQFTTLTVSSQKNVATPYSTAERTMSIDNFSELTMAPMINNLAGKVALDVMTGSEGGVCNFVSNVDGGGNIISPTSEGGMASSRKVKNLYQVIYDFEGSPFCTNFYSLYQPVVGYDVYGTPITDGRIIGTLKASNALTTGLPLPVRSDVARQFFRYVRVQ